jgi:Spy/CpxP family protein refolding chaperone
MFIRHLLIALTATLAFPLAAAAQSAPAPAAPAAPAQSAPSQAAPLHHHHDRYMEAVRSLSLTPDQQQKIAALARERKAANAGADAPTRHANAKKFRHDVAGLLTPDQRAQLHTTMAQGRSAPAPQQ